jgi:hypothetical protein
MKPPRLSPSPDNLTTNTTATTTTTTTIQTLEHLTTRIHHAMRTIDCPTSFAFLTSITTPRIHITMPQDPGAAIAQGTSVPREAYLKSLLAYKARFPTWTFETWNMTTSLSGTDGEEGRDEVEERAEVWTTVSANVNERGTHQRRELLQKIRWVRRKGRWLWCGAEGMYGPPQVGGVGSVEC